MSVIDVQLLSGTVGAVLLGVGVVGLLALAAGRGRRWWCRRLPAALLIGAGASAILMVSVNVLWRPFPDPLPAVAVLWTGLGAAAVARKKLDYSAVRPHRSHRGSTSRRVTATETSDFYELIVERHRKRTTIVTSNRKPAEWLTMTADTLLAQSAIDRLTSNRTHPRHRRTVLPPTHPTRNS